MKKRVLAGMLLVLAACSVTACGKKNTDSAQSSAAVSEIEATAVSSSGLPEILSAAEEAEDSLTSETSSVAETAADSAAETETVPEGITLEEDMASVSDVLLARMIADYEGMTEYDVSSQSGGETFWKELSYLVSSYGTENSRIKYDEKNKVYTLKKAQLRYYAASLYSDLKKAKKLPDLTDSVSEVTKKGSKWKVTAQDIDGYSISIQSCSKEDADGVNTIVAYLVDTSNNTSLGKYSATVTKSPYTGSKSPFHYTVITLEKMTKMSMETVLVGGKDSAEDQTSASADATASTDTSTDTSTATTDTSGSYGQALTMPGTDTTTTDTTTTDTTATDTTTDTTTTTGTDAAQTTTDTQTTDTTQTSQNTMSGASIDSDTAMSIAKSYYGTKLDDGTEYTYNYEGTTTYQNTQYYNFSVNDSVGTVINILVSGDGSRVFKGTNSNGTWTMQ